MDRASKDEVRKELEKLIKISKREKDTRMLERYLAITLAFRYLSVDAIAEAIGRTGRTVYTYINTFLKNGLDGLTRVRSTGRKSYLNEEKKSEVVNLIVQKTPESVGFPAEMNWTSPLLREWIKQKWDIHYSDRGVRDLMYSLNLSFTRPTYTLAKADPEKQAEFKKNLKSWQCVC